MEKTKVASSIEQAIEENQELDIPGQLDDGLDDFLLEDSPQEFEEFETRPEKDESTSIDNAAACATAAMALSAIKGTVSLVSGYDVEFTEAQTEKFASDMAPFLIKYGDSLPGFLFKYQAEITAAKALGVMAFAMIGQIKKQKQEKAKPETETNQKEAV